MDVQKARDILRALANGTNPITGESFDDSSPYQHAEVVRARFLAVQRLEAPPGQIVATTKPDGALAQRPAKHNAGKPWSREDERELLVGFDAGLSVRQLAERLGRSTGGIEARLVTLGRLELSPRLAANLRGLPEARRQADAGQG
jgi:DNA-binding NarL/FixJ family response regulator